MTLPFDPFVALCVMLAVTVTDFIYVVWMKEVVADRAVRAGLLSGLHHLVAAFAIVSYTKNWIYVLFSAVGGFLGVYLSIRFKKTDSPDSSG